MASATATKDSASQDVEMKDVEKTDNGEEVKKDPDILTLEGLILLFTVVFFSFNFDVLRKFTDCMHINISTKQFCCQ